MHVRIARFDDLAEPERAVAEVRQQIQSGPPPGLEGVKRLLMLIDRQHGRWHGPELFRHRGRYASR